MATCYTCNKLIFSKKVIGAIGNDLYYFCSDRCKQQAFKKIGVKDVDFLDTTERSSLDERKGASDKRKLDFKDSYNVSKIEVSGAEFSYSAKTDRVTIKVKSLVNKSNEKTGSLRFELFLSKKGGYHGKQLEGTTFAITSVYEPLRKNYNYSDISSTVLKRNDVKGGSYYPTLFIKELLDDGNWHIASYVNFPVINKL